MYGLPSTNVVYLYSLTAADLVQGKEIISELKEYFVSKGYDPGSVVTEPDATIDHLRSIPRNCSVFFFNTHTLFYRDDQGVPRFLGFRTADKDNEANQARYASEIAAGRVRENCEIIMQDGQAVIKCDHLYITEKFLRKYWRFTPNSFVFIQSCYSFDSNLQQIITSPITADETVSGCGAGVYGGWTLGSVGDEAVRYLFDRLLGANLIKEKKYRENPPQRPFDLERVMTDKTYQYLDHDIDREDRKETRILFRKSDRGDLGLLAPSIEHVEIIEEMKEVHLVGFFGADQSKIRVFVRECQEGKISAGDTELFRDRSVGDCCIVCKGLPDNGPGSAGYIVAVMDYGNGKFVESNPVPITAWHGKVTYTLRLPDQDPDGSGIGQITCDAFLRGDIHRPRENPGEPTQGRPCRIRTVQDPGNPARYTSGGSYTNENERYIYTWHGSGSFTPGSDAGGTFDLRIYHRDLPDPIHPGLEIFIISNENGPWVDIKDKKGQIPVRTLPSGFNVAQLRVEIGDHSSDDEFLLKSLTWAESGGKYEPSYDIPGKTLTSPIGNLLTPSKEKVIIAKLTWETLKATYTPDELTQS